MDGQVKDRERRTRPALSGLLVLLVAGAGGCGISIESHRDEFQRADTDHDGLVSHSEFDAVHQRYDEKRRSAEFKKADADHNQQLSLPEYAHADFGTHRIYWALGVFSAVSFFGSLLAIPMVVVRLPVDHFIAAHEAADWVTSDLRRRLWLVLKNLLGIVLVAGGVIMLVLPGQGVLTILLGVALTDFPGKWRLMRALAHRPNVMKALNWMREKAHQPPLAPPPPFHEASTAL
jgi:hypothetical protein